MADKGIPDISSKLSAPKKISGFEKQRQEAEAKRLREEAENRAALREFESSFAEDDDDDPIAALAAGRGAFGGSSSRDEYVRGAPMRNSGPGTLGPAPGPGPPPPSLKRKRELDQERERRERESERADRKSPEPAAKRPTMLLSSLPRNTTEQTVRSWIPPSLKVDDMAFVPSPNHHSLSAIVALTPDTASSDIDQVVNQLQQKYLGFGFHLTISKHITISSHVNSVMHTATSTSDRQPFGAKPMPREPPRHSFRNAPPPEALPPALRHQGPTPMVVNVTPPSDLKVLQVINKTVEKLIAYGPEWECLLMAQPEVQHGEHWAWLFDNTSPGHVWYRWLVWQYYSSQPASKDQSSVYQWTIFDELAKNNDQIRLFDDGPFWLPPPDNPKFEHVQNLGDMLNDSGYVSSDLDTDDEDDHIVQAQGTVDESSTSRARYLNPYRKAKLTFFLNHLPDSTGYLCEGDVQAITDLVIKYAGQGAEEVVDMLVSNLENPFCYSVHYNADKSGAENDRGSDYNDETNDYDDEDEEEEDAPRAHFGMLSGGNDTPEPEDETAPTSAPLPTNPTSEPPEDDDPSSKNSNGTRDISGAQLVALYIISDSLAATSVSGVRDAWKYRSLFETSLTSRHIFETLGRMPKQHKWGRVRTEQWKSRIGVVLDCWEAESIFSNESLKAFRDGFLEPPLTGEEKRVREEAEAREREEEMKRRWKSGEQQTTTTTSSSEAVATTPATQQQQQQQEETPSSSSLPRQRSRPTAADLITATAEKPEAPPPKPAPKLGNNFSISLNAASPSSTIPPSSVPEATAVRQAMGFSLGGGGGGGAGGGSSNAGKVSLSLSVPAQQVRVEEKKTKKTVPDVFGDSDSEG